MLTDKETLILVYLKDICKIFNPKHTNIFIQFCLLTYNIEFLCDSHVRRIPQKFDSQAKGSS